jgi:DNA-directed RNA polymerase subunit alpha
LVKLALPKIECIEQGNYGKFTAKPVEKGFGVILGNSIRRVALSSLRGAAVSRVTIEGITQEFSTIPGMKEDVMEFLLNVRDIRIKINSDSAESGKMTLKVQGGKVVSAGDIEPVSPLDFEIVNKDLYLATLDSASASLEVDFEVTVNKGYQPISPAYNIGHQVTEHGMKKEMSIDAVFSPVTRANYSIEPIAAGEEAGNEKLTIELWTDGTLSPVEAMTAAIDILKEQFDCFTGLARTIAAKEETEAWQKSIPSDVYNMPLEKLNLSTHTYNSLRRGGITMTGQLLEKGVEGLMSLGGFGVKSREEVEAVLKEYGVEVTGAPAEKEKKAKKGRAKAGPEGDNE